MPSLPASNNQHGQDVQQQLEPLGEAPTLDYPEKQVLPQAVV